MSNSIKKLVLIRENIGTLCLKSEAIEDLLIKLGREKAEGLDGSANVVVRRGYGKRSRVYVNMNYKEASKDNKLLKAVHK